MDEFLIHLGAFSLGIRIYFQTVTESNRILTRRQNLFDYLRMSLPFVFYTEKIFTASFPERSDVDPNMRN